MSKTTVEGSEDVPIDECDGSIHVNQFPPYKDRNSNSKTTVSERTTVDTENCVAVIDNKHDKRSNWTARTVTRVLVLLCLASVIQGALINGFINVVISTVERRFSLTSVESGFIASFYDIASFLCLLPVSYLGGRGIGGKPAWIGVGLGVMGVGSLLFALPHFVTNAYIVLFVVKSNILHLITANTSS